MMRYQLDYPLSRQLFFRFIAAEMAITEVPRGCYVYWDGCEGMGEAGGSGR